MGAARSRACAAHGMLAAPRHAATKAAGSGLAAVCRCAANRTAMAIVVATALAFCTLSYPHATRLHHWVV